MAQDNKARNGETIGTRYRNGTVEKDHKGNGDPNRPSVIKRREKRAAERAEREAQAKRDEKNRKARERRAAAKVAAAKG